MLIPDARGYGPMTPAPIAPRKRPARVIRRCDRSIMPRRGTTVDRDRRALDVTCALRAQEQRERGNVLRGAEAARVALGERLGAQLVDRSSQCRRALFAELLLPFGVGVAGVNDVHVDVVAVAELGKTLGEAR